MITSNEAFQEWLSDKMPDGPETRIEFAKKVGASLTDLEWAFTAGWAYRYKTLTTKDI